MKGLVSTCISLQQQAVLEAYRRMAFESGIDKLFFFTNNPGKVTEATEFLLGEHSGRMLFLPFVGDEDFESIGALEEIRGAQT